MQKRLPVHFLSPLEHHRAWAKAASRSLVMAGGEKRLPTPLFFRATPLFFRDPGSFF
jgi:hypothetical protein